MLAERVRHVLERIAKGDHEHLLIVTHAIVIKAAISVERNEPLTNVLKMNIALLSATPLKLRPFS